jgi:drug/metabolite transporter (DMT)-like permease
MQGCTFVILDFLPTGLALSFFQLSAVLSVFLGWAFFGEPQFARRFAGACTMALGAALLVATR